MKLKSLFGGGSSTVTQEPMQTDEQKRLMKRLEQFATTGQWGDYQAGAEYGDKLGEYGMTGVEGATQNRLLDLISNADSGLMGAGKNEIMSLLTTDKYDPYSDKGVYSGFSKNVDREAQDVSDSMKRNMAITGDLFSTDNARQHGLLAERTHDTKTNKLAELYDTFAQRKLGGAQTAVNMAGQEMDMLGQAQQMGALQRLLKDQEAKEKYAAWQNQRADYMQTVQTAKDVFNKDIPYGVMSYTTKSSSPFSNLLNAGLGAIGTAVGGPIGAWAGGMVGNLLNPQSAGGSMVGNLTMLPNAATGSTGGWTDHYSANNPLVTRGN